MIVPNIKPITQKRMDQLFKNRIGQDYRNWRFKVLARDNYQCQFPSCGKGKEGKLEVHHIQKWSSHKHLRTELFNGITLCSECHDKIAGKEHMYTIFFYQLVRGKSKDIKKNEDTN